MIFLSIFWGHPVPAQIIGIAFVFACLFTGIMAWLLTRNFAPELEDDGEGGGVKRPFKN